MIEFNFQVAWKSKQNLTIKNNNDIIEGDQLEFFEIIEVERKID